MTSCNVNWIQVGYSQVKEPSKEVVLDRLFAPLHLRTCALVALVCRIRWLPT